MISVFWIAPAIFNQVYLVLISCMAAWWLTRLPDWTILVLLIVVSFYDIFAVLTPKGPLKLLVEEAQERKEPLPGLLYEGKTLKLGLGDFVFYSVLVGKASMYDFTTCVVCIMAILFGLSCTLFILGMTRKALPALPISIFLGILFFVLTRFFIMPMVISFGINRIHV
jgi:presenilin 1